MKSKPNRRLCCEIVSGTVEGNCIARHGIQLKCGDCCSGSARAQMARTLFLTQTTRRGTKERKLGYKKLKTIFFILQDIRWNFRNALKSGEVPFRKIVVVISIFLFVPQYKLDRNIINGRVQNRHFNSQSSESQFCVVSVKFGRFIIYVCHVLGRF